MSLSFRTVTGKLIDVAGNPLPGVKVVFALRTGGLDYTAELAGVYLRKHIELLSDEAGEFSASLVCTTDLIVPVGHQPPKWVATIFHDADPKIGRDTFTFPLSPGESLDVAALRLAQGTVSGSGSLTFASRVDVREVDGSPAFAATTIEFPSGTLASLGGGVARYTPYPVIAPQPWFDLVETDFAPPVESPSPPDIGTLRVVAGLDHKLYAEDFAGNFVLIGGAGGGVSTPALYASQHGVVMDSSPTGGGTDNTAALQALLNLANSTDKPTRIVIDGWALTAPLRIYSNTTLEGGAAAAGLALKSGSNDTLLRNANPSGSAITDHDITVRDLTLFGNRAGLTGAGLFGTQRVDGTLIGVLQFYGVRHLRVQNVNVIDSKSIAIHCGKLNQASFNDIYMEGAHTVQQGGVQIEGNSSHITFSNLRGKNLGDDLFTLSPDGAQWVNGAFTGLGPYVVAGDVTDVTGAGLDGDDCVAAIRLFSNTHRADRIAITGVTGTFRSALLYNEPGGLSPGGNIGTVSLSHAVVHMIHDTNFVETGIGLWGNWDNLILNDITFNDPEDPRGHFYVDPSAHVKHIDSTGFRVRSTNAAETASQQVMVYVAGYVEKFDSPDLAWLRSPALARAATLFYMAVGGKVDHLFIDRLLANRVDNLVHHATATPMQSCTLRNVRHLDATDSSKRTFVTTLGTISLLDMSGWYSDAAGRFYDAGGLITANKGDAFVTNGVVTLVAGVATIPYTDAAGGTKVQITPHTDGGTVGVRYSVTRTANTSITITAKDAAGATQTGDTSTLSYQIID
jgi:hypothetical protein